MYAVKRVVCMVFGHGKHLIRTGFGSLLCMRCDKQVFDGPIQTQAKRHGKKLWKDRHKKEGQ